MRLRTTPHQQEGLPVTAPAVALVEGQGAEPVVTGLRSRASGADTKAIQAAALSQRLNAYVYHATFLKNLEEMASDGLRLSSGSQFNGGYDAHSKGRCFFCGWEGLSFWLSKMEAIANHESDFNSPQDFGWMPVALRISKDIFDEEDLSPDELGYRDSGGNDSWFTAEGIDPEHIEVWNGRKWTSVEDVNVDAMMSRAQSAATFESDDDGEEAEDPGSDHGGDEEGERSGWWNLDFEAFAPHEEAPVLPEAQGANAAPSGDRGDLAHEADSAAFKAWFGNSKVVDDQGQPLVVYHGTRHAFDQFQVSAPPGAVGNPAGVYFTPDRRAAEEYAMDVDGAWDSRSRVIAAYLRITDDAEGRVIDSLYSGREFVVFDPEAILVVPPVVE